MKWVDDGAGWKGPTTSTAFKGADNGTSIACLTPSDSYNQPLSNDPHMARCYFQVGGAVREVAYVNKEWTIIGTVPI